MKAMEVNQKVKKHGRRELLHYFGLGIVYALGLFVVALQLRSLL